MDTEALLTTASSLKATSDGSSPPPEMRRAWLSFGALAALLLSCASLGAYCCTSATATTTTQKGVLAVVQQDFTSAASFANPMDAWSVGKKIHPPHPKKLHHGEVLYTVVEDPDVGRYYKREFLIPCGYGLLVFNIGPADKSMPYDFDVFDDGYVYSDNGGLCLLYPSYRAHQNDTEPFWNPDDATSFHVPLGNQMTKISTRINQHEHVKPMSKAMEARGGDYLIMAKHNFYTPRYYRALKQLVNSWPVTGTNAAAENEEEWTAEDLQVMVEMAMDGAAAWTE